MRLFIEKYPLSVSYLTPEILRIQAFLELQGHLKIVIKHPKESFFLNNLIQHEIMHSHSTDIYEVSMLCLVPCFALQGARR